MTTQSQPTTLAADDEITANILSIEGVPRSVLPDSAARAALSLLAATGRDCYCYHAGPADGGVWNVWLGPLAGIRDDHNGRVTVAEWSERYVALVHIIMTRTPAPEGGAA